MWKCFLDHTYHLLLVNLQNCRQDFHIAFPNGVTITWSSNLATDQRVFDNIANQNENNALNSDSIFKKKKKKNQNSIRIQFMKLQWVIHFWIQIIPLAYQKQTSGLAIKHYFLDLLLLRFIFTRAPSTSGMQIARDISTPFPEASECASPVGILCCSSRWIEFGT